MDPLTIAVLAGFSALEYWLGKTNKVKAGSTAELALGAVKSALTFVLNKKGK